MTGYRLGLDVGANSIGWCLLDLDADGRPCGVRDLGVRIFSDGRNPKDRTSLAVARRTARAMRRRRDRYLARRTGLLRALIRHGLMPAEEGARKALERLDPYELRARGLDAALTPAELGRALFHMNQRRGFRSNRKVDAADEAESGKIRSAANRLLEEMDRSGARTLGELLWMRHRDRAPVRARLHGEGAKAEYELYPQRDMLEAEFAALWRAQARHHPALLTQAAHDELHRILFFQRPLKPVRAGKCTLDPSEERAAWALPSAQASRVYRELANLRLRMPGEAERPLTRDQRDALAKVLLTREKCTFDRMRRLLKLPSDARFNLESEKRKHLDGDKTAAALGKKTLFGTRWHDLPRSEQEEVVERLLTEEDEAALVDWLREAYGLDAEVAEKISRARLPAGYGNLGPTALSRVTALLEAKGFDGYGYHDAASEAYGHHSDFRDGEIFDKLPYYGRALERHVAFGSGEPGDTEEKRIGRLANPTVHIALNQIRRVINAIAQRHGPPREVIVEVARELKQSIEKQREIQRDQTENQQKNDERRRKLRELGLADTGENRLRLRLWEELNPKDPFDRNCVYTGENISLQRLFGNEVEVEHILPFSRTLDNSFANKTVSLRRANRLKGNLSPYEAFKDNPTGFGWEAIVARAANLHRSKVWRFAPDAMERYESERGFLDRHLTDTQYIARLCYAYLGRICDPNRVWVTPGRLTAMLRGKWGLNSLLSDHNRKERTDHRHHAVDAAVVAATDRGLLNSLSRTAARAEAQELTRVLDDVPVPFEGFRSALRDGLGRLVVSVRPDHKISPGGRRAGGATSDRLHNDTAYGIVSGPDADGRSEVVHRKALSDLKSAQDIEAVRDACLRTELLAEAARAKGEGRALKEALQAYTARTGVRRVRVVEKLSVIPIADGAGAPYKAYKGDSNHCYDIFATANGKWRGEVVSTFDANRRDFTPRWPEAFPDAMPVMRLHKDDMVELDDGGGRRICRVVKFSPGQIVLAEHFEGGNLKLRDAAPNDEDPFKYLTRSPEGLRKLAARPVHVDPAGRVFRVARAS